MFFSAIKEKGTLAFRHDKGPGLFQRKDIIPLGPSLFPGLVYTFKGILLNIGALVFTEDTVFYDEGNEKGNGVFLGPLLLLFPCPV